MGPPAAFFVLCRAGSCYTIGNVKEFLQRITQMEKKLDGRLPFVPA